MIHYEFVLVALNAVGKKKQIGKFGLPTLPNADRFEPNMRTT